METQNAQLDGNIREYGKAPLDGRIPLYVFRDTHMCVYCLNSRKTYVLPRSEMM